VFVVCTSLGDGTVRVAVTGELTADGAAALRALVAVPPGGARRLELDLTRVTFLDAAGVRAILRLRRTALRAGGRLMITAASDAVNALLSIPRFGEALGQGGSA
jgi:anti-anti-sigma factor